MIQRLRRVLFSSWIMPIFGHVLPELGYTERTALEAGSVWWDGDLFSGKPDWAKLLATAAPKLSKKEAVFLNGPVEELCQMLNHWQIRQQGDLPPEIWSFIKRNRLFGIIIPEQYGGLEFSAVAHSAIVTKIASRSVTAAVTVMVPNSLGPAELLLHYGTQSQKDYYLPRLARGDEIPCFGLTEPEAGSDAASTRSVGVLCHGMYEGRNVLGIRINWQKRYITLGPVATLLGLAFRLTDPDQILGENEDLGITCAIIPTNLEGITIGARHDPMGVPFQNGPNEGNDVFIPADFIIGGIEMAGKGWKMLMESLAAGRSISLPALSVAGMQLSTRIVSAYGTVREQFDTPIERFEGIEEPLARIGGLTYMMNAARVMTAAAVDQGESPAVISAIVKAYLTEGMRRVVSDAMDIRAGAGVCRGPRNQLEQMFTALPIAVTVEGANILTRSLIIFGQGAIRCHPFVQKEMSAVASKNLKAFDQAFFGHLGFILKNVFKSFGYAITGGRFIRVPINSAVTLYLQRITRMSTAFALLSDAAMGTLGGTLKKHEKLSGRFADILAWMYLASSSIKRFVDEGEKPEHLPFLRWSCEHALFLVQNAMIELLNNFPIRPIAWILRFLIFPIGHHYKKPSDLLGASVAHAMCEDLETRDSITSDIFIPHPDELGLGRLEVAFKKSIAALPIEKKLHEGIRSGLLEKSGRIELIERAEAIGLITTDEREIITDADKTREEVIQVDQFTTAEFSNIKKSIPEAPIPLRIAR